MAVANVAVPMTLGCVAGAWILARHPDELLAGISCIEFIAAIGIWVSMNALPVLGAILGEMGLLVSRIGHLALGVAGLNNRYYSAFFLRPLRAEDLSSDVTEIEKERRWL